MKKIEKPSFYKEVMMKHGEGFGASIIKGKKWECASPEFDEWWQREVEPLNELIDKAVKVYQDDELGWWGEEKSKREIKQAYLIDIQEIKPKTREQELESFIKWLDEQCNIKGIEVLFTDALKKRTKALLEGMDDK